MSAAKPDASIPFAGCLTSTRTSDNPWTLVGIADDSQSSFLRGAADAPAAVRLAYDGRCYNSTTESGVDLSGRIHDGGDLKPGRSWKESAQQYQEAIESLLLDARTPFVIGGDHAITIPVTRALHVLNQSIHVIQIDAHPDLYPEFEGNSESHACTGSRMLEMPHVATVTQLGIRAMNLTQSRNGARFEDQLRVVEAKALAGPLPRLHHIPAGAAVYLTIDMDAFDPAYAPGVSHPVPGGLTARQVLNFLQAGHWNLVGADVVEVNPSVDVHHQTAILAARLLHECVGYAAARSGIAQSSA